MKSKLNLVKEASDFFNITEEEVQKKIKENPERAVKDWHNSKDMADFYKTTDVYIFGLIEFNCKERLDNILYPVKNIKGKKILDFAGGIGILSIILANKNKVDYYDVDSLTKDFAKKIVKSSGSDVKFIENKDIDKTMYDAIFTMDVLEHLKTPMETVKRLDKRLNPGGLMITTGLNFSIGEHTPMHLPENVFYRKELAEFFSQKYACMFFHPTRFETIYVWRKKYENI